jgi:hypothetical protein
MAESEQSSEAVESEVAAETPEVCVENVHKPTAIASGLYPKYVKTLQEADEVMHRFENNTKSRFCVWRSPKDFGHSGMDFSEGNLNLQQVLRKISCSEIKNKQINMSF